MPKSNEDSSPIDQQVATVYRELADEQPSTALDTAIRREARAAAERQRAGQRAFFYRPLALAAACVLCVAVVIQIQVDKPSAAGDTAGFGEAADRGADQLRDLGSRTLEATLPSENGIDPLSQPNLDRCSEIETADPDRWHICIERLRQAGRESQAQAEERRLRSRFPDFEAP